MKKNLIIAFLLGGMSLLCPHHAYAKKKAPDNKKAFVLQHYMLQGGVQYGIGLPLSNRSSGDIRLVNNFSHNMNFYLKLRLKKLSIYGGVQTNTFMLNRNDLSQFYSDFYIQFDYSTNPYTQGTSSNITTPYIGLGYHFNQDKIEIEPFVQVGMAFQNYQLGSVVLQSKSNPTQYQTIVFQDFESANFVRPTIGLNASRKIFNFIRLKGSVAFDAGRMGSNEIQEITYNDFTPIRRRNLYLENSSSQIRFMLGIELTPFNKIFLHEKKYQKWSKRHPNW